MILRSVYLFFCCWQFTNFCQSYVPLWLRKIQFYIGYMVCEREFFNTLHGIEIKFNTINYHDLKICISFLCGDPQIFCQSYGPLWLKRNQFNIGYMVCEREFFNTLHGIEIKLYTINYHDLKMCISVFLWRSTNSCQSYVPLWLRKIQFYVWYTVFEREIFNTLHGVEIKLYTINYHDFEICISFFCDDSQIFARVMSLYD